MGYVNELNLPTWTARSKKCVEIYSDFISGKNISCKIGAQTKDKVFVQIIYQNEDTFPRGTFRQDNVMSCDGPEFRVDKDYTDGFVLFLRGNSEYRDNYSMEINHDFMRKFAETIYKLNEI